MPSKTTKKARRTGSKKDSAPVIKDDGTRWLVVRGGRQVYLGPGILRQEAERLARGLLAPAEIAQVS